ncbi:MAG: chorismate-binding protein, partial [bacterium]|nr:chorismate-binding protein [bacterium]
MENKNLEYHELPVSKLISFLQGYDCFALLETSLCDDENYFSYICYDIVDKIIVEDPKIIIKNIEKVEKIVKGGYHVVILLPYEAAFNFEPRTGKIKKLPFPCIFLMFKNVIIFDHIKGEFSKSLPLKNIERLGIDWKMRQLWYDTDFNEYKRNIEKIKEYIEKGDTYQVNYTIRCRFNFSGSVYRMYLDLKERQRVPYSALIKCNNNFILSFSPELF